MTIDTIKLIILPIIIIIGWILGELHVLDTTPSEREKYEKRKETIVKYYRKYFRKNNETKKVRRTNNTNVLFE